MIEEAKGDTGEADRLFKQALSWNEEYGFMEIAYAINLSYGEALTERGAFREALEYVRAAALAHPRPPRTGI